MKKNMLSISCVLIAGLVGLVIGRTWATKPTVASDGMVGRANIIVTGKMVSVIRQTKTAKDKDGNWLPQKRRIKIQVDQVLKANLNGELEFDCNAIAFEQNKPYIFFLTTEILSVNDSMGKRKVIGFNYLDAPAKHMEATGRNLNEIKHLIKTNH